MTRHKQRTVWALVVGSVLLPGCLRLADPRDQDPWKWEGPPPPLRAEQRSRSSPYHALPRHEVVVREERRRLPEPVERVNYPEPPPRPEPLPVKRTSTPKLLPPADATPEPTKLPDAQVVSDEAVIRALRCYMDKKPTEATRMLDCFETPSRDALMCLLPLAARYGQGTTTGSGSDDVADLVERVHTVTGPLRKKEPLRIERLSFCRQIQHFGVYEPLPEGRPTFHTGCDDRPGGLMLVYAELRNFVSQSEPPFHVTKLGSRAEIRDSQGMTVWSHPFGTQPDKSRTQRRDYFITYRFCVPPELRPGDYTLWIEVQDTQARPLRKIRRSLDFSVVAAPPERGSRGEPLGRGGRVPHMPSKASRGRMDDETADQ